MAYFSEEQTTKWRNTQAMKPIGAKVVLTNAEGKLLIVKPTYKPGWQFVGGAVEKNESPLQGAFRETKEEINVDLDVTALTFKAVTYEPAIKGRADVLFVIFAAQLTEEQIANIEVQREEIEEYQFVSYEELTRFAPGNSPQAMRALMEAGALSGYTESGQPEIGVFITEKIIPAAKE
ncbi:NUDIX hydrolase [candidate division TM7 genomosp. GTL1]|nr:NUDIX hydrolase [candidate division TM7 genomosp. GTL1]